MPQLGELSKEIVEPLGDRRVREDLGAEVAGRDTVVDSHLDEGRQLVRLGTEERSSEDEVGLRINQRLQQSIGLGEDLCLGDGASGDLMQAVLDATALGLLLCQADLRQWWCGEDTGRQDATIVYRALPRPEELMR